MGLILIYYIYTPQGVLLPPPPPPTPPPPTPSPYKGFPPPPPTPDNTPPTPPPPPKEGESTPYFHSRGKIFYTIKLSPHYSHNPPGGVKRDLRGVTQLRKITRNCAAKSLVKCTKLAPPRTGCTISIPPHPPRGGPAPSFLNGY